MNTALAIEPVRDDEPAENEVVQEVPASGKHLSVVEVLRASFAKPGKYVLNCAEMTEQDWHNLYPPIAKEVASLPGSGKPFWHYEWNYCTKCDSMLPECASNPYGYKGAIGKARLAARSRGTVVAQQVASINESVPSESNGTSTRGKFKQVMPPGDRDSIRAKYIDGGTINGLSDEFLIRASVIRDFLFEEGILRKQGANMAAKASNVVPIKATPPPSPPAPKPVPAAPVIQLKKVTIVPVKAAVPVKAVVAAPPPAPKAVPAKSAAAAYAPGRRGRVRSTRFVTPEDVTKVTRMLAKGQGGGMVAIANSMNLQAQELSAALKAAGVVITKGPKGPRS